MKNIKEIKVLITAIYYINKINDNENKDISELINYLFKRCYNTNINLLTISYKQKNKNEIIENIKKTLQTETIFFKYLEENN